MTKNVTNQLLTDTHMNIEMNEWTDDTRTDFLGWAVGRLVDWWVGWLVDWLVGWLVGWLVSWLVG